MWPRGDHWTTPHQSYEISGSYSDWINVVPKEARGTHRDFLFLKFLRCRTFRLGFRLSHRRRRRSIMAENDCKCNDCIVTYSSNKTIVLLLLYVTIQSLHLQSFSAIIERRRRRWLRRKPRRKVRQRRNFRKRKSRCVPRASLGTTFIQSE